GAGVVFLEGIWSAPCVSRLGSCFSTKAVASGSIRTLRLGNLRNRRRKRPLRTKRAEFARMVNVPARGGRPPNLQCRYRRVRAMRRNIRTCNDNFLSSPRDCDRHRGTAIADDRAVFPLAVPTAPNAMSAAVVSRRLRKRGCMAPVPLQPSAQDEEEPRISPWARAEHAGQGRRALQTLALRDLRNGQISGYRIEPSPAEPASKGGCIHAGECAWNRGKIMEPALVEEAVKLRLVKCLELNRNVVTQLVQRFQAAVRDKLRRIETAA